MAHPRSPLERVRSLALTFPDVIETHTWEETQFRVGTKIFVFAGEASITVKADPDEREGLLADPRFFVPAYVGARGWVGMRLGASTDWDEVAELLDTSYRMIAPRRLVARLDDPGQRP
ncbi:MAG: MmcQ/YjbR family DNA-binding protein [Acidimicrobiales bacterium]